MSFILSYFILQVGYILSAYFYGYIPMQLLAGWMADKFGVRHVLGTGMLIGGVLSVLSPVAARLHWGLFMALRVLMGFSMGVIFPCVNSCVAKCLERENNISDCSIWWGKYWHNYIICLVWVFVPVQLDLDFLHIRRCNSNLVHCLFVLCVQQSS